MSDEITNNVDPPATARFCAVGSCSAELFKVNGWRVNRPKKYKDLLNPPEPLYVDVMERWSCPLSKGHIIYICPFCKMNFFTSGHISDKKNFYAHVWGYGNRCEEMVKLIESGGLVQDAHAPNPFEKQETTTFKKRSSVEPEGSFQFKSQTKRSKLPEVYSASHGYFPPVAAPTAHRTFSRMLMPPSLGMTQQEIYDMSSKMQQSSNGAIFGYPHDQAARVMANNLISVGLDVNTTREVVARRTIQPSSTPEFRNDVFTPPSYLNSFPVMAPALGVPAPQFQFQFQFLPPQYASNNIQMPSQKFSAMGAGSLQHLMPLPEVRLEPTAGTPVLPSISTLLS